ncbi:TPA: cysteine desulfurase [Thermoplasmata archaeon]|nr:cysteine desulfurase [Thermoplasmata archaeon]
MTSMAADVMNAQALRRDFPILSEDAGARPPIYLDSACQTLRPKCVIDAMNEYYRDFPACAGRSAHRLATEVSIRCDDVRTEACEFFGAAELAEIAFMKNSTEGLNTVISGSGLSKGDEVVTTDFEHNSVHVPLVRAASALGVRRRVVRSLPDGTFDLEAFDEALSGRTKLVAMCLTSNVTGHTLPAREIVEMAHARGAKVLFDAAQTAPSRSIDVRSLGVDYLTASAHKMMGPSGVGILYAEAESGRNLPPLCFGGHGITGATLDSYELLPPPERFEAGLQNYSGIIGTGAALRYLRRIGLDCVSEHEAMLNKRLTKALRSVEGVSILEPLDPNLRGGILSFNVKSMVPHDVAMILDNSRDIMVRAGMHCCHSLFESRGIDGAVRASMYLYNTADEVDELARALADISARF